MRILIWWAVNIQIRQSHGRYLSQIENKAVVMKQFQNNVLQDRQVLPIVLYFNSKKVKLNLKVS